MSTELQHIADHFATTVEPSILEQYKDSEKWQAILNAVIDQLQKGEDAVDELSKVLDFRTEQPTGYKLDWLAGLVNLKRNPDETDSSFFTRFVAATGMQGAGTPDGVIYPAALMSGDSEPQYMDEAPATFFVYDGPCYRNVNGVRTWTEGGMQLTRKQVKNLAPAGVLGLPGAAIRLANGSLLGTSDGKILLLAAKDKHESIEIVGPLVTDDDLRLLTDDDTYLEYSTTIP